MRMLLTIVSLTCLGLFGCQQREPNSDESAAHAPDDRTSIPAPGNLLTAMTVPKTFDIHPFIGPLPLKFGMRPAEVHKLLGKPEHTRAGNNDRGAKETWRESSLQVIYDMDGGVKEVMFFSGFNLLFLGAPLRTETQRDPVPTLLKHDPQPVESVGILIFPRVGISTDGFHGKEVPEEERDPTLTVFRKGDFDQVMEGARKPNLSKYRAQH